MTRALEGLRRYWLAPGTAQELASRRILSYGLFFLLYLTVDDRGWAQVSPVFWDPISFFRFLPGPPRSDVWIGVIQTVWKVSLLTSALGVVTRLSTMLAAALGFFVLGLPSCFGMIHHLEGFPVLLLFVLAFTYCSDAWSLDARFRRKRALHRDPREYQWPIVLAQTLFLLVFFSAGFSKLRHSGLHWINADNMRFILWGGFLRHEPPTQLGAYIARSDVLCTLCGAATILVELSALPAIFFRRIRVSVLIGLFALQALIGIAMGIYFTPHLAGYALFVPWERLWSRLVAGESSQSESLR